MIRERLHFTVKTGSAWNDALGLIREIDEIQIAAGRATGTVWTQVVGPFNEMVIETDFPDLATYERESEALHEARFVTRSRPNGHHKFVLPEGRASRVQPVA